MNVNIDFANPPRWFVLCSQLHNTVLDCALERLTNRGGSNVHLNLMPQSAIYHFINCLSTSEDANKQGRPAVAISLLRQCVEALVVIDAGLQDISTGDFLLDKWQDEISAGNMRKLLEQHAWQRYGTGLWTEPWSEFFTRLASAVQPYAHYGPKLQAWQIATLDGPFIDEDGSFLFLAETGLTAYDPLKASRITLFHALLIWCLAELLRLNGGHSRLDETAIADLRESLASSDLLDGERTKWDQQFWATLFFLDPEHRVVTP